MLADIKNDPALTKEPWSYLHTHVDYEIYQTWRKQRQDCAESMSTHLDECRPFLKELGVDSVKFALNFVNPELERTQQLREADQLVKKWQLPELDVNQRQHICDPRTQTKKDIVQDWYEAYRHNPNQPKLMMAFSNTDTRALNDHARFLLKQDGVIAKTEFIYTVIHEEEDDFKRIITHQGERASAKGDRLLFTHNDKGLGVNNGTLGTIEALNRRTIQVRLDRGDKIVSFAPKLYPYFDQGWAATIHKNQGATTNKSLILGSFEMSRNLTYVGMTRHEEEATLYYSDIDFWRQEKVFDRLSRAQEKLSSLDYVNAEQLYELAQEDDKILTKFFNRMGNQWEAIRYVSHRAVQQVSSYFFGHKHEYDPPIAQGSILEEERARELFAEEKRDVNLTDRGFRTDPHLEDKGNAVHIAWPATEGEKKIDFNDILKVSGKDKIIAIREEQLPRIAQFEKKVPLDGQDKRSIDASHDERVSKQLVSSPHESRACATANKTKEPENIQLPLQTSRESLQQKGLIEHYLAVKNERNKYSAITATPEEKKIMISLRRQIDKLAFEIAQDKSLLEAAKQQGISKMIASDSLSYAKSLQKDKSRGRGMGF